MKKISIAVIGLIAVLLLASCGAKDESNVKDSNVTKGEVENIKELVNGYSVSNKEDQSASITSRELIVTNSDDSKTTYDLPEDEFFVSIAPYINETHPCETHSLTGCQGELVEKEFDVKIEDSEGNKILDESMKSHANGFIDLWLPRDKTYHIAISYDGKTVESEISTFEDDNTCVSTMQLM